MVVVEMVEEVVVVMTVEVVILVLMEGNMIWVPYAMSGWMDSYACKKEGNVNQAEQGG